MLRSPLLLLALAASCSLLTACEQAAAESCQPLLTELRGRLIERGYEPSSETLRNQLASASRLCMTDPGALALLLQRTAK